MKRMNHPAELGRINEWIFPCGALLLLILAWVFGGNETVKLILAILSFLVSVFALRTEALTAIRERDFRSGLLLLIVAIPYLVNTFRNQEG